MDFLIVCSFVMVVGLCLAAAIENIIRAIIEK
jgi:hypothetical protein